MSCGGYNCKLIGAIILTGIVMLILCIAGVYIIRREHNRNKKKHEGDDIIVINIPGKSIPTNINPGSSTIGGSVTGEFIEVDKYGNVANASFLPDYISCYYNKNCNWDKNNTTSSNKSLCAIPYFGNTCSRESYNLSNYTAVGSIVKTNFSTSFSIPVATEKLSFTTGLKDTDSNPEKICTKICDDSQTCSGVYIEPITDITILDTCVGRSCFNCNIITDKITVNSGIQTDTDFVFKSDIDSNLYIKKTKQNPLGIYKDPLIFLDRVFIYTGNLPLRYWLNEKDGFYNGNGLKTLLTIKPNIQYNLGKFSPTNIINNTTNLFGVFANSPFPPNTDFKTIIMNNNNPSVYYIVYVSSPNINLPSSWTTIYAYFIPLQ